MFKELSAFIQEDTILSMHMKYAKGLMTVTAHFSGIASPLCCSGTPAEMDAEFLPLLQKGAPQIQAFQSNLKSFSEALAKEEAEKKATKKTEKTTSENSKTEKTSNPKPAVADDDLFANPVNESPSKEKKESATLEQKNESVQKQDTPTEKIEVVKPEEKTNANTKTLKEMAAENSRIIGEIPKAFQYPQEQETEEDEEVCNEESCIDDDEDYNWMDEL